MQIADHLRKTHDVGCLGPVKPDRADVLLQSLHAEGQLAILLVEQYVDFCREVADRFYAMDRGAVVMSGDRASMNEKDVRQKISV